MSERKAAVVSIKVENITKTYGAQEALSSVSFALKPGEVVGFLGPNGAGKSTMLKILTSYLPPSSGEAWICGFSVLENEKEVKRRIGYLPEHNPLYLDQYVVEFLEFCLGLHGIRRGRTQRINEIIDLVGLGPERHKKIGQLSKGYRQRVGLAQALLHKPEVLLLDEPTTGLDPNQLVEIRALIKEIGKEKTVLFSTHILPEVEAICQRVLILNHGQLVADRSVQAIAQPIKGQMITVELHQPVKKHDWQGLIHLIDAVEMNNGKSWQLNGSGSDDWRAQIALFAKKKDWLIISMAETSNKMEDVFRQLTGSEL